MIDIGKFLIALGILIAIAGVIVILIRHTGIPFGRLPGDIIIQRKNFTFYFPLATGILLSIVISLLLYFFIGRK